MECTNAINNKETMICSNEMIEVKCKCGEVYHYCKACGYTDNEADTTFTNDLNINAVSLECNYCK